MCHPPTYIYIYIYVEVSNDFHIHVDIDIYSKKIYRNLNDLHKL